MTCVNPVSLLHRWSRRALCLAALALAVSGCRPAPGVTAVAPPAIAYPSRPGDPIPVGPDSLRVVPRGSTAFPLITSLIARARVSVHLEMYEFSRADLAAALAAARNRGVAVTVIEDPSVAVTRATATRLRAAGIDVVDYPVRRDMIDHVKLLVVDASVAVVGGINWGETSDRNHDVDAAVTGPVAANLERVFLRDLATCGRITAVPPPVADDRILVATTLPGMEIRPLALRLIEGARSTLDLELYVLTDTAVVHAVEAARMRGVRVRVVLDPSERPSDGPAAELLAAGVPTRRYRSSGEKLHAKLAVADGRDAIFGSANWTSSGFGHNHELDIEVLDSPDVASQLTAMVDADWSASAVA